MKIGDVSRQRRFADPARLRWYAQHRALRFALRMKRAATYAVPADTAQLGCGHVVPLSTPLLARDS